MKIDNLFRYFRDAAIGLFFIFSCCFLVNLNSEIVISKNLLFKEIAVLREEVVAAKYNALSEISSTRSVADNRLASIEKNLLKRVDILTFLAASELDVINGMIAPVPAAASETIQEYKNIASKANKKLDALDIHTNCDLNDYCWQNLATDTMLDTRNMVRNVSKSSIVFNQEFPKMVMNVSASTHVFATEFPKIVSNTTDITGNINRLTKPKWYDRALSFGATSTMMYFNVNKGMGK